MLLPTPLKGIIALFFCVLSLSVFNNANAQCTYTPSNIVVSGLAGSDASFNGTYVPNGLINGAQSWHNQSAGTIGANILFNTNPNSFAYNQWEIVDIATNSFKGYGGSSPTYLPPNGWAIGLGLVGVINLTGGTGSLIGGTQIVTQPDNPSVCISNSSYDTSLSIFATSGSAITYQWLVSKDGGNSYQTLIDTGVYKGSATSKLSLTHFPASYNGYKYACSVSGACGTVTSSNTTGILSITPTYAITANAGKNGTISNNGVTQVCQNSSQTYTITPNNGYTVDSVWVDGVYQGPRLEYDFNNVSAVHTIYTTFTPTSTLCNYTPTNVTVTGASNSAELYMLQFNNPYIPTGSRNGAQKWVRSSDYNSIYWNGSTWQIDIQAIPTGSYSETYTGAKPNPYYLPASGWSGGITLAGGVGILVAGGTSITTQPTSTSVCAGSNTTLSVSVTSNTTIVYQWLVSKDGGNTYTAIADTGIYSGSTTNTLTLTNVPYAYNGYSYKCTASSACGVAVSTPGILTVSPTYNITATAGSGGTISSVGVTQVCLNTSRTYTITPANGYSIDSVLIDGVYQGAISSYTFNNVSASHTIRASFFQTSSLCSYTPRNITAVFDGQTYICSPDDTRSWSNNNGFWVFWNGTTWEMDFWDIDPLGSGDLVVTKFDRYIGSNPNSNYLPTNGWQNGSMITSGAGNVSSQPTTITTQPISQNICVGNNTSFNIIANSGTTLIYQWLVSKDGGNTYGALSDTGIYTGSATNKLTLTNTPYGYNGYQYYCTASSACGIVTSSAAILTVLPNFSITASAGIGGTISSVGITQVCTGTSVTYTITKNSGYKIDSVLVDGVNQGTITSYTFSNVTATHTIRTTFTSLLSITSFSPASATVGSTVTITGTNFNTTAANNIVFFGATRATVSAATATQLTVTVPAGATYAPITELNVANHLSGSSLSNFTPVYSPAKTRLSLLDFSSKVDFAAGSSPYTMAMGDLDGDGKSDIAAVNLSSSTVSVYRNTTSNGSIVAGSFAGKVDFTTGTNPYSVVISDVDGDGKPDMVVTNYSSNTVSIFRNSSTSGSISFATRVDFTTGSNPKYVAIGDLDGDGKPDLAVSNYFGNTISVFRNLSTSGNISFAGKIDFSTGSLPAGIAMSDVDGDGMLDIGVVDFNASTVSVFYNQSNVGTINLAAKVDFATGSTPGLVAFGDVDGDGKSDLVITNQNPNTISVLRNTATIGSITTNSFAPKVDFATGNLPIGFAISDITGDGKADIVVANNSDKTLSVLRNTATSGSITSGSFAAHVDYTVGTNPNGVVVGDLDGDGLPEIVTANAGSNNISILRQVIPVYPPSITSFSPTIATPGSTVTITGTNFSSTAANNIVFFGATQANVITATTTQMTVSVPAGATYTPITAINTTSNQLCNSIGNFNPVYAPSKTKLSILDFPAKVNFTAGAAPLWVAIADIDGDGKPDLVEVNSSGNTVSVLRSTASSGNVGSGSFATKIDFGTGITPRSVAIGDIDGDGKPDLVVNNISSSTISVFRNTSTNGNISFATRVDYATNSGPYGIAISDLDGDGKMDVVVSNYNSNNLSIYRNLSTVGSISFASNLDIATGANPLFLSIGDVDNDGISDIAVANAGSSTVSVLRNLSNIGTLSFATKVDFATGATPYGVAIGDIDGDNIADLAVVNYGASTVSVLRNTSVIGNISFATHVDYPVGTSCISVTIGDITGDGKPDLFVANSGSASISILRNTATSGSITSSSFATKVDLSTGNSPYNIAVGDIDGDGMPDLVVPNANDNTVSVLRNIIPVNPPSITSFSPASATVGATVIITGTNFNTTAANNIVFFGATQATVTSATATQLTVTVPTGATYASITELNMGTNLSCFSNSNFNPVYSPAKTSITNTDFATKVDFTASSSPLGVAIGDVDGDGKPDMVVVINGANTISVYQNTSTTGSTSTSSFGTKVDFATGSGAFNVKIGDIDGDGKPEIVVVNQNSSTVSVFRNTSTRGTINSSSFAAKVDFAVTSAPIGVVIGDIDGDGKPDLAVTNNGTNSVSVLRNTSTIGSINFATKVDFGTGTSPLWLAIGDLDGDGNADLAIANGSANTVSVLRNTSPIGSISFAAKVDFATGSSPRTVVIGDLDGDGKPEMVINNYSANSISVLRNTASVGSITSGSFATNVDFATGTQPNAGLAIGDIDGNGKPDIVVSNTGSNTVSVFRNTATNGSITSSSFATKVDYTTGSNPYFVAVCDLDGDGLPDLATVNAVSNTLSVLHNKMPPPIIVSFSPTTAAVGTTVTINGLNLVGATGVSFGGVVATSFTVVNATSITAIVPSGAASGNVSVTTPTGTGSLAGFTICIQTKDTLIAKATGSYTWHGTTYTASTTTATFDTTNAAGCDSLTTLHLTIIPAINTWTGTKSTDWNDPANWSSGVVPDSSQDVVIASGTNKPVNNSTLTAKNLIIESGATITNNGTLNVYGNFTDSGSFISTNGSKVVLAGTGTVSGTDTFANLEIKGDYKIMDSIAVTQRLIKTSGSLNTNNRLTLISNATGTALIEDDGGSLVGKATIQHFAGGNFGFHHFATPVSGTTVNDWSNAFPIFGPDGEPAWLSNRGSLQIYNEPANKTELLDSSYYNYTNLSNPLVPGQGYTAWLNSLPTLKTLGTPNNGAISFPVTSSDTANEVTRGWNLVGNPYPSPISWSALLEKNASILGDKSCYLWKADGNGTNGTWETFNGTAGVNGAGDIINSSLGFFVYVNQSGNLNFDNSVRNYDYTSPEIFGTKSNTTSLRLSIKSPNATTIDEAVAYTSYKAGFSRKMPQPATATNPTIAFDVRGTKAAINVLTAIDSKTELPITVLTPKAGTYTLALSTKNSNQPVYLKDAVTGTYTDLSSSTTITTTTCETAGRYSLVFSKPEQLSVNSKQLTVFPNPSKDKVVINGSHIASVEVVDNLGRVVKVVTLKDATNPTLSVRGLAAGAYHLKVQTSDGKVNGANLVVSY